MHCDTFTLKMSMNVHARITTTVFQPDTKKGCIGTAGRIWRSVTKLKHFLDITTLQVCLGLSFQLNNSGKDSQMSHKSSVPRPACKKDMIAKHIDICSVDETFGLQSKTELDTVEQICLVIHLFMHCLLILIFFKKKSGLHFRTKMFSQDDLCKLH